MRFAANGNGSRLGAVADLCAQSQCLERATGRMYWPDARPSLVCDGCGALAIAIADHIGIELAIEPLARRGVAPVRGR